MKKQNIFAPCPGFILAKPYISEEQTFKNLKEEAGSAQKSEVLAVGDKFVDDHGNLRTPPCKVGDVILHSYIQNDYEVGFDKYRAVRFYEVIGVLK
jgi:co-chaperonin GroES (HSP10)